MYAQEGACCIDVDLGVEERIASSNTLRDAERDGDGGGAAGSAERGEFGGVRIDNERLLGILGKGGDLFEGRVAFDEVLRC